MTTLLLLLAAGSSVTFLVALYREARRRELSRFREELATFERLFPGRCYLCAYYRFGAFQYGYDGEAPPHDPCPERGESASYRDAAGGP